MRAKAQYELVLLLNSVLMGYDFFKCELGECTKVVGDDEKCNLQSSEMKFD
jgi:hypothetical protein